MNDGDCIEWVLNYECRSGRAEEKPERGYTRYQHVVMALETP